MTLIKGYNGFLGFRIDNRIYYIVTDGTVQSFSLVYDQLLSEDTIL